MINQVGGLDTRVNPVVRRFKNQVGGLDIVIIRFDRREHLKSNIDLFVFERGLEAGEL